MSDENTTTLQGDISSDLTEEEKRRIEKYSKIEQSKAKRSAIIVSVTAFLIILFVGGVVGGAIYLSSYEPPEDMPSEAIYYAPLPEAPEEIIAALIALIPANADKNTLEMSVKNDIEISDEFVVKSDRDYLKNDVSYIREAVADRLNDINSSFTTSFGEDFKSRIPVFSFEAKDIKDAVCEDDTVKNKRKFTVTFDETSFDEAINNSIFEVFKLEDAKTRFDSFKNELSPILTVTKSNIHCASFEIYGEANSVTGVLDFIRLRKVYTVNADVEFIGDFEAIGTDSFTFTVQASEKYSFLHAGINITKPVLFTEKGKSDEIIIATVTDEPHDEISIKWESSAPEVLSVNEKGYFKAHKVSTEPVTVTAVYEYLGFTYKDTCLIYVREPADGVKVSKQELSLKSGETAVLTAVIKPTDATITTVYWFSEDESIATVNKETGEVTAKSEGNVKIYCLTLDGNYRDSCELTVTE